MGYMLQTMAKEYNLGVEHRRDRAPIVDEDTVVEVPCKIEGFIGSSYGKFGTSQLEHQIIMEYNELFPYAADYLPRDLRDDDDFVDWLSEPDVLEMFATQFVMTLPGNRLSYYQTSDVAKMRSSIFAVTNDIS